MTAIQRQNIIQHTAIHIEMSKEEVRQIVKDLTHVTADSKKEVVVIYNGYIKEFTLTEFFALLGFYTP